MSQVVYAAVVLLSRPPVRILPLCRRFLFCIMFAADFCCNILLLLLCPSYLYHLCKFDDILCTRCSTLSIALSTLVPLNGRNFDQQYNVSISWESTCAGCTSAWAEWLVAAALEWSSLTEYCPSRWSLDRTYFQITHLQSTPSAMLHHLILP